MEVHAHSHTARKKWTHYFWEFLMLFLAVFCGFLAEYQLEHKIEKEKAKQYIHLFYDDLKTDTASFSRLLSFYEKKIAGLSGRNNCFDSISREMGSPYCLQELLNNSANFTDLVYTDRTLQQLKNAGGIRLLKQADADSILLYDNMLRQFKTSETTSFQEIQTSIRSTLFSLVNFRARNAGKAASLSMPLVYYKNEDLLNRYFNQLETYASGCEDNYTDIAGLKKKATGLINYFKTKYRLD